MIDLNKYREEVETGLEGETEAMDRARERKDFYDYDGKKYNKYFRRDSESWEDWHERSHRQSGFLRKCIDKLCANLYQPGPSRKWSEPSGDEFLQGVYRQNHINALMLEADKLSTLNTVIAIQIDAGDATLGYDEEGSPLSDYAVKPITYRLWEQQNFWAWTSPDDDRVVEAVCVKDMYDTQVRYRLWSDTEVWTFLTKLQQPGLKGGRPTSGGTAAELKTRKTHDYGCLPFTFIHYDLPVNGFHSVKAPGNFLVTAEIAIDNRLMKTDESIDKHMNPLPWVKGADENLKIIKGPLRFLRLPREQGQFTDQGYQPGDHVEIGQLEMHIDVAGCWDDLDKYDRLSMEAVGLPLSSIRMEQMGVASGIALMVEQEPLLKRAEGRRSTFKVYECDLGKRTLTCAGNHYGKPALLKAAETGDHALAWPTPQLAVMTQDLFDLELQKVQQGVSSHIMLIMKTYNVGRDEALEIAKQIKEDAEELAKLYPEMAAANAMPDPKADAEAEHERNLELTEAKKGES